MKASTLYIASAVITAAAVFGSKAFENHTAGVPAQTQTSQLVLYGGLGLASVVAVYGYVRGR